jgi:hypothetical protein
MQKILLILLFVNSALRASEAPRQTPSEFIIEHLLKSKVAAAWWGKEVDWKVAILTAGTAIKTKGPGTIFRLSHADDIKVHFEIEPEIAQASALFTGVTPGTSLQITPDTKTTYGYLFKENCITTEFYLGGTSTWTLAEFRDLITKS